jgi:hypothetical protein
MFVRVSSFAIVLPQRRNIVEACCRKGRGSIRSFRCRAPSHIPRLFVYPYYENPRTLAQQMARWPGPAGQVLCAGRRPGRIKEALLGAGAAPYQMNGPADWTGLFWRYLAAEDPTVKIAVFRDCDSRLTPRERAAVYDWLASGGLLQVMRDHPRHDRPIMGGMWGVRCEEARWIPGLRRAQRITSYYQVDQLLLANAKIWKVKSAHPDGG